MPQQTKGITIAVVAVAGAFGLAVWVGRILLLAGGAHELPYPAVTDTTADPTVFQTEVGKPTVGLDLQKMLTVSPPVLAKGKELYDARCVMCHGLAGKGDGAAAVAFTPRPRDFTKPQGWTVGVTIAAIYTTLSDGIKGTAMPAFDALTPEERFAVVHYVQSFGAFDHHDNPAAEIAQIDARYHLSEGPLGPNKVAVPTVMTHMVAEFVAPPAIRMPAAPDHSPAAELCRRLIADSVRAAEVLAQTPDWRRDVAVFARVVSAGAPGNGFQPAVADLTAARWREFHDALVARTPAPAAAVSGAGGDTTGH